MDMFASMDIVLIFEVILSLLALIFAYDTLTGEYEHGTLRLVLTHPVPRGHILLAKYISAMLCLLVPLLMSLLLSIHFTDDLYCHFSKHQRFFTDRWDCLNIRHNFSAAP